MQIIFAFWRERLADFPQPENGRSLIQLFKFTSKIKPVHKTGLFFIAVNQAIL